MPGKRCALYARWIIPYAVKCTDLLKIESSRALVIAAHRQASRDRGKIALGLLRVEARNNVGHHRSRSDRYRTARAFESHRIYAIAVIDVQIERELVPAERIDPLGTVCSPCELAEMSRLAGMIEYQLAV